MQGWLKKLQRATHIARRLSFAAAMVALLQSGCTKRYRETERFGLVTVHADHVYRPLNWENNGGVERWTIVADGKQLITDYAQVYAIEDIVVVDAYNEAVLDRQTVFLNVHDGKPATCTQCTCPLHKTPIGPALLGPLSNWASDERVSWALYPPSGATSVCAVTFASTSYTARLLAWPESLAIASLRVRDDGSVQATGCKLEKQPAQPLDQPWYICELLELTETETHTLKSVRVDQLWYL